MPERTERKVHWLKQFSESKASTNFSVCYTIAVLGQASCISEDNKAPVYNILNWLSSISKTGHMEVKKSKK